MQNFFNFPFKLFQRFGTKMFLSLVTVALSTTFPPNILHLTDLPPNDGTGYFVMIHSDGCGHCDRLAPTFSKAAELGEGFATWAELNCHINQTACKELRIEGVPRLFYFLNGRIHVFEGMQLSRIIVNWASNFVNNTAIEVNAENYTETEKAAFLFTNKPEIPKIWAGVERAFNNSAIKFYVSRDQELLAKLGQKTFPGVYVKNGAEVKEFTGKLQIHDLKLFLKSTFGEKSEEL
ncbi:hypothetical protein TRFO_22265 [Tritrichomonas foetus]|uniref:Thioredoxin domain-containing protein n=1 Tax=Tritrichomonas foetus TaxID=1144522 RepID=A0A1J4KH88_9EUKA|nr:hypothetical protein TRFO_22265 [Tritrichomonas foetus]|eukprot:OHT09014.1 hypothetical protein TRFO_22265 [Tritrichomonas foetus]